MHQELQHNLNKYKTKRKKATNFSEFSVWFTFDLLF